MTGNEPAVDWGNLQTAARDAIQGLDHTQNTDAKFDNIFKILLTGSNKHAIIQICRKESF